jgi:uncharacterized RDD family membrane protein YckC
MEQQSYLSDLEFNPVLAGAGQRFLNYLIDLIVIYVLIFLLAMIFALQLYQLTLNDSVEERQLKLELIGFLFFFVYYFICETAFKGRTIGKFVTGTKAVNEDGTEITAKTALLRTLCRMVPFEPFSAFGGHPWHDKWTKTYVVNVKKTTFNEASVIS